MARNKKKTEAEVNVAPTTDTVPAEPTEAPAEMPDASNEEAKQEEPKSDPSKVQRRKTRAELDFLFTADEFAVKAKRIAELELKRDGAQLQLDSAKAVFKEAEAEIDAELQNIVSDIRAGKEKRSVEVIEVKDFAKGKVIYLNPANETDEYAQRDMRHDERQMSLIPEPDDKKPEAEPEDKTDCFICRATGELGGAPCEACDGKGYVVAKSIPAVTDAPTDETDADETEANEPEAEQPQA